MSLSLKEFEKKLALYGSDLEKWPHKKDTEGAKETLREKPRAQTLLDEAISLDNALDTAEPVRFDSDILEKRVMAALERDISKQKNNVISLKRQNRAKVWSLSFSIAASILIVVILGIVQFPPLQTTPRPAPQNTVSVMTVDAVLNKIHQERQRMALENMVIEEFFDVADTNTHSTRPSAPQNNANESQGDPEVERLLDDLYGDDSYFYLGLSDESSS